MSVAEQSQKAPTGKRTSYGILIKAGSFILNEWGLNETDAKTVHAALVARDNKPFELDGLTFSRREPSTLAARLAEFMASPQEPESEAEKQS